MDCQRFRDNLDALVDNSGSADELRVEMQLHGEACPECAALQEQQRKVSKALSQSLQSCRAPEKLRGRILAAAFADKPLERPSASVRLRREFNQPLSQRVFSQLRRSPYFAASLFLHGAAAAIIIVLLLAQDSTNDKNTRQVINSDGGGREYIIDFSPYVAHKNDVRKLPGQTVNGQYTSDGFALSSPEFLVTGALVLVDDPDRGCIKAYPEDSGAVGQKVEVGSEGGVTIPLQLAQNRLGSETSVRIVQVSNRLEFWPLSRWQQTTSL